MPIDICWQIVYDESVTGFPEQFKQLDLLLNAWKSLR